MNDLENFRQINSFEKKIILRSLSTDSSKILQTLDDLHYFLYISFQQKETKNNYPVVFLITMDQKKYLDLINVKNLVYSVGLYFGFIKRSVFFLSLEGSEFLYENEILSESHHLSLNKKGEKSILYGNDILKENVIIFSPNLRKDDFLVIKNTQNEIIAIAKSLINKQDLKILNPRDKIALNLVDKGYYLRKSQ